MINWIKWKFRYLKGDPQQKALCKAFEAHKSLCEAVQVLDECGCHDCKEVVGKYRAAQWVLNKIVERYVAGDK